jgi:hypothetical protein
MVYRLETKHCRMKRRERARAKDNYTCAPVQSRQLSSPILDRSLCINPLDIFAFRATVAVLRRPRHAIVYHPTRGGRPVAPLEQVCASEEPRGLQYKASLHPRLLLDSGLAAFISANWQFPSQYTTWHWTSVISLMSEG